MTPGSMVPTTRALRFALDLLFGALVVLTVVVSSRGDDRFAPVLGLSFVLAVVYGAGRWLIRLPDDVGSPRRVLCPSGLWVISLGLLWALLLVVSPVALWLAFPLMFLQMHVLGPRAGVIAVALTTSAAAVRAFASGMAPVGSVLGPGLGAGVAVGVVLGLEAIAAEAGERARVIGELTRTRQELARTERERATTAERERLAREIHDTLAQGFSSIGLLLRAVERDVRSAGLVADPQKFLDSAVGHLAVASEAVEENLLEARRVVRALAPPALDGSSLVPALERLADSQTAKGPLVVEVEVSGDPIGLPVAVEAALLRIAQSALANVVQHARAGLAKITLTFHGASVTLDVVDDGIGFDPTMVSPTSTGGFGIAAMRSRVVELGGTLEIESAPRSVTAAAGSGRTMATALAVALPVGEES